jgi:tight adherence protein C
MTRLWALSGIAAWFGVTLLLAESRRLARPSLTERLRPYSPGAGPATPFSVTTFRDLLGPLATDLCDRAARCFGVGEELERRLARIHSPLDVSGFRLRQLGWALGGLGLGAAIDLASAPPVVLGLLLVLGAPLLAFLVIEQRLASASKAWQRRLTLELPVVVEQLAMLIGAGYSLGAGLARLAGRSHGAAGADLARLCGRIRHGLSESAALTEWAEVADVECLHRLVPILALHSEAPELGRLISEEARSMRRDVGRSLVEIMERRAQQVWIPVTVAALVPGVIFLAVPFIQALRAFSLGP